MTAAYADDAAVLPKGVGRLMYDGQFYLPITERFNRDGDKVRWDADFNANLNSNIFPALNNPLLGPNPSLGRSVVTAEQHYQKHTFQLAYGITNRFSLGINIPYWYYRNNVSASLDTSTATVGKSAAAVSAANPLGLAPCNSPGCTTGGPLPGTTPLTTNDAQALVRSQGFKTIESVDENGFGDLEVGGRYQYYNGEYFRGAFTGGARFPTGKVDDPDNLMDFGFGAGTYALLFQFNQDFMLQRDGIDKRLGFPSPGALLVNTTFRYDLTLPDEQELHVCSPRAPLCSSKDNVSRDLGDILEAEISAKTGLPVKGLILSALYKYGHKFKDQYSGDRTLPYGDLAIDSEATEHVYIVGLTYTTIPLVMEKKFSFPFVVSVFYRERFAGTNALVGRYIGFNAQIFYF